MKKTILKNAQGYSKPAEGAIQQATKFEVGKTYRSETDSNLTATITKRTENRVDFQVISKNAGEVYGPEYERQIRCFEDDGDSDGISEYFMIVNKSLNGFHYFFAIDEVISGEEENSAVVIGSIDEELDGSQEDDEEENTTSAAVSTFDNDDEDDDELVDEAEIDNAAAVIDKIKVSRFGGSKKSTTDIKRQQTSFEIGKRYFCTIYCFGVIVKKRTAKTVTYDLFKLGTDEIISRDIRRRVVSQTVHFKSFECIDVSNQPHLKNMTYPISSSNVICFCDVDASEYAVTAETQDAAIEGEEQNAQAASVEENSAVVIGSIDEELDGSQEDDEESTLDTAAITLDVDDEDDDELVDEPDEATAAVADSTKNFTRTFNHVAKPHTYHVLALNQKGRLTFDGKVISRKNAASEVECAQNWRHKGENYQDINATLLTDEYASRYLSSGTTGGGVRYSEATPVGNVKWVDFGRDSIPYINREVDALISWYQAEAAKEDIRKANDFETQLEECNYRIEELSRKLECQHANISSQHKIILTAYRTIAFCENYIWDVGLAIDAINAEIEKMQKTKKTITDQITTKSAFQAINKAAASLEDDGSNDEPDEESELDTVAITFDDDDDADDDELVDDPETDNAAATVDEEIKIVNLIRGGKNCTVAFQSLHAKFKVGELYLGSARGKFGAIVKKRTAKNITFDLLNLETDEIISKDARKKISFDDKGSECIELDSISVGYAIEFKYRYPVFAAGKVLYYDVDASEYAITAEAQDAAIEGEIHNAKIEVIRDTIDTVFDECFKKAAEIEATKVTYDWQHYTDEGGLATHEYDVLKIGKGRITIHHTSRSEVTSVSWYSLKTSENFNRQAFVESEKLGGRISFGIELDARTAADYTFDSYEAAKKFADRLVENLPKFGELEAIPVSSQKSTTPAELEGAAANTVQEVDADEYAVTSEAQDVATQAEIDNAAAGVEKKSPTIDFQEFWKQAAGVNESKKANSFKPKSRVSILRAAYVGDNFRNPTLKFATGKTYHGGAVYIIVKSRTKKFLTFDVVCHYSSEVLGSGVRRKISIDGRGVESVDWYVVREYRRRQKERYHYIITADLYAFADVENDNAASVANQASAVEAMKETSLRVMAANQSPTKFELERFSNTEQAELQKQNFTDTGTDFVATVNAIQKAIEETERKLVELKAKKARLKAEEFGDKRPYSKPVFDYVDAILTPLIFDNPTHFNITTQSGKTYDILEHGYYVMIDGNIEQENYFSYEMGAMTGCKIYCQYQTLEKFKSVIRELAESIKRGDKEFKFPADSDAQ